MLLQGQLRNSLEDAVDFTPMVDVVFQLLIFLMLTYRASVPTQVEVPEARHGTGVEQTEALILTLTPPAGPGQATGVFDGSETDEGHRLADAQAIKGAVQRALNEGRRRVVLQADGKVPHGEVLRVAAVVAEIEGMQLHIGVRDPDDG